MLLQNTGRPRVPSLGLEEARPQMVKLEGILGFIGARKRNCNIGGSAKVKAGTLAEQER
jgi:hypothetical protein